MTATPPIIIPTEIDIPDLWGSTPYENETWWPVNFLVGGNGTGKTRFAERLRPQLEQLGLNARTLGADRLAGLEKGNVWQSAGQFHRGMNIGDFTSLRQMGKQQGRAADAFVILKEKADVRIRLDALLETFFKRRLRLSEEGGFLRPKLQRIHGGHDEYELKDGECHGLKELLALLSFIYDDEFNCLIIDEPEINLHPQFQTFLFSEMRRIAGDPRSQPGKKMFFLITHSPYFLDFRSINELRSLILFQPDRIPCSLGELSEDDEYRLTRLLPRLNTHHKQFFFASRPIFVEGYRDQQLFTLIQEKRNRLLGITGACFIDVNGKVEQDLFYRLCQQYGLEGQFISDLDALTRGNLKESLRNNTKLSATLGAKGLGTDLRDALAQFCQRLDALEKALAAVPPGAHDELRLAVAAASERETKRYRLLILLQHRNEDLHAAVPDQGGTVDYLTGKLARLCESCAEAGLHLLPLGALENHCPSYDGDAWNISENAKTSCFKEELDFLLEAPDPAAVEARYPELIPILDFAQGASEIDLDRHLGNVIGEWIAIVQSKAFRGEITDGDSLKSHSSIDWKTNSRLFELLEYAAEGECFICRLRLSESVDAHRREIRFDEKTVHARFAI